MNNNIIIHYNDARINESLIDYNNIDIIIIVCNNLEETFNYSGYILQLLYDNKFILIFSKLKIELFILYNKFNNLHIIGKYKIFYINIIYNNPNINNYFNNSIFVFINNNSRHKIHEYIKQTNISNIYINHELFINKHVHIL
jgi:hypothetical protein